MSRRPSRNLAGPAGAALLAALALPSCGDDVTCVFTTGCRDPGPGALAGNPAVLPVDGQRILDGPPVVERVLPDRDDAPPSTPVVVVFSESMNEDVLEQVELVREDFLMGPMTVPTRPPTLLADGRVLVLLPTADLESAMHSVRVKAMAGPITDLTGQALAVEDGDSLGTFTVDDTATTTPSVLGTFPEDAEDDASDTPEIVVAFDRAVQPATVSGTSLDVLVGGAPPSPDPAPVRLTDRAGVGRVYTYRSQNAATGVPTSFAPGAAVQVTISPAATPVLDADGDAVDELVVDFTTTPVSTPTVVRLLSNPPDAIGIAHLDGADPMAELMVEVELGNASTDDRVDLFFFGTDPDADPAQLIALRRQLTLTGAGPFPSLVFDAAAADLVSTTSPLAPRFADGAVAIAARTQRGGLLSPLRVFDADDVLEGIQDALLDTVPPTIEELYHADGATDVFPTDQRRLVLAGVADEELASVEVVTPAADNGTTPPVVGSAGGNFLAAPVAFDPAVPVTTYTAIGYDRALNPSPAISGTATHLGIVGPTAFTPGDPLTVEVFDAITLEPVVGALVLVHSDDGTTVTFDQSTTTDGAGVASFASAAPGALEALATVELPGYDLFTLHGVPATRVSIPLLPTVVSTAATVTGDVLGDDPDVGDVEALVIADTRRPASGGPYYPVGACTSGPVVCPHGPEALVVERFGSQTLLGGDFTQTEGAFGISFLLKAFELSLPRPPVAMGGQDAVDVPVPFVLGNGPEELRPFELPAVSLDGAATLGLDFMDLVGDPAFSGDPEVRVEAILPGLGSPAPVGLGLAFLQTPAIDDWNVRSGLPGDAGPLGDLGGRVDRLFLRASVRDGAGNQSVRRVPADTLGAGQVLALGDVPGLIAPAPGGASGLSAGYDVRIDDMLPDALGGTGFHRIELRDAAGRGWRLWRLDTAGTTEIRFHVPSVAPGTGLADGTLTLVATALSVPDTSAPAGFGPSAFLWSDLDRVHDARKVSEPFTYSQP